MVRRFLRGHLSVWLGLVRQGGKVHHSRFCPNRKWRQKLIFSALRIVSSHKAAVLVKFNQEAAWIQTVLTIVHHG